MVHKRAAARNFVVATVLMLSVFPSVIHVVRNLVLRVHTVHQTSIVVTVNKTMMMIVSSPHFAHEPTMMILHVVATIDR